MDELGAIRASQAGDRTAFGVLIDRYYKSIYRLAYQFTGNHQDADDVCQETFFRAFGNIRRLRDSSRFKEWIFVIASNLLRKRVKDARYHRKLVTRAADSISRELSEDEDVRPFERLASKEKAMIIHKQLRKMPEHMRLVTILILMEGFTQKDTAGILNCSEASVSRHLGAARNWLRAKLQNLI